MKEFLKFLTSKAFLRQLLYVVIFLLVVLFAVIMWLRVYTNHGQKLTLPDYTKQQYEEAAKDAKSKSFEIIINDSIFRVGMPGGIILDQNPLPGAEVKEKRKIYVNVTKFSPDKVKVKDLPVLYGSNYDQKKTELKFQDINTKVIDKKHDKGEPNHILEVYYNGKLIIDKNVLKSDVEIEKGGTLEVVISQKSGGHDVVPDLVCKELQAAESIALISKFKIGKIEEVGEITDRGSAYVMAQNPAYDGTTSIPHNSEIAVTIIQEKPQNCN